MELFAKLFDSLLVFVYHCFDRIVIHGYLSGLSRPEQVVHFVRHVLGTPGLFRNFDATHGAGPGEVAGEYGRTRARRSSKPARPYIWRLIIFSRLICPST